MKTSNYPIVKILIPFVSGIIWAYFGLFPTILRHFSCIIGLLFLLLCFCFSLIRKRKIQWIPNLTLFISFVFAGFSLTNFHFPPKPSEDQTETSDNFQAAAYQIIDFPVTKEKSVKAIAYRLDDTDTQRFASPYSRKVILYFQRSPRSENLQYGDVIFTYTALERIRNSANPNSFDNQTFLRRKGITHSGYVQDIHWKRIGRKSPNLIKAQAKQMQQSLGHTLSNSGMSGQEYDIIKAILLGDDDTMEPQLKASYAAAGVSHILCVSGMHVGIIFMIIDFLLKPMNLFKSTRITKTILVLLIIWTYAHITGLSPSVTRSATMFSFVSLGTLIHRHTNIFHSLFTSLFILLIINPLLLFEVGFQLSYLAVFGIVLFQPIITGIYTCKTKIGNYFWELLSVSIAAQLSTFPISTYYFGQFPNYFMISNLSVISLSFAVMITGILLLTISFLPLLTKAVAFILTWEIRIMNHIITFVEQLPRSVTQDIDFTAIQVIMLYSMIAFLYAAIKKQNRSLGWVCYGLFTLFSTSFAIKKITLSKQSESTCYEVRKSCAIGFCDQQESVLFSDSIQSRNDKSYQYAIKNHVLKLHTTPLIVPLDTPTFSNSHLCKCGNFIQHNHVTYYLLQRKNKLLACSHPIEVDILLLQHNPSQHPEDVSQAIHFRKVVADASNTEFYMARWRDYCIANNITFQESGKMD